MAPLPVLHNHKDIGTMYHVFAIGAGLIGGAFSVAIRMELQVPGMQLFADGVGTGWPMLWAIGFVFVFTAGGVTGVVLASPGVDRLFQDTYYVVAHFHYVLSLGAVFAIFAGWYYWFPKITGYMYSERLGKLHFWLTSPASTSRSSRTISWGSPGCRIADYPDAFAGWNLVSSIGAYVSALGLVVFLAGVTVAFVKKRRAAGNPWGPGAVTLEWTLSSPPPFHQFQKLPKVTGGS